MSLRELFREPVKGPLTCDFCGRFVSVRDAHLIHEYGDYGSILSTEVECPLCYQSGGVVKLRTQETVRLLRHIDRLRGRAQKTFDGHSPRWTREDAGAVDEVCRTLRRLISEPREAA